MTSPPFTASAGDQLWLQRLAAANEFLPKRLSLFLVEFFFNVANGRALILQPSRNLGYFYVKASTYDRADLLAGEIKSLLDLFVLLARLRSDRMLYLLGAANPDKPTIFLGDLFEDPRPSTVHLVLNSRGDYSFRPDTIQDADDNVMYKGVLLDGEVFELINSCIHGIFYLTEECRQQYKAAEPAVAGAVPVPEPAAAARRWPWLALPAAAGLIPGAVWLMPYLQQLAPTRPVEQAKPVATPVAKPALAPPRKAPVPAPAPEPERAPVPVAALAGIDISKWNRHAVALLQDKTISFAFARASYGLATDPEFANNWKAMGQSAIVRGAYHAFSLRSNPRLQAEKFVTLLGAAGPRDLCPAVDFEQGSLPPRGPAPAVAEVQSALLTHLDTLEKKVGCVPFLYTNLDMGNRYLDDPRFARYPLWIADWTAGAQAPLLPKAWTRAGYRVWQKSDRYSSPASPGEISDFDVFAGTAADLASHYRRPGAVAQAQQSQARQPP